MDDAPIPRYLIKCLVHSPCDTPNLVPNGLHIANEFPNTRILFNLVNVSYP